MTECRIVGRPRLLELVAKRWSHRVVSVVAGPGFGKSVLIAQATAENALAPRGWEITVACTAADRSPAHFLNRLAAAADVPGSTTFGMERIMAELVRRWPMGLCIVVDDVHHVGATREGVQLIARMVTDAPAPVRFLLAGRAPVRGIASLRATGAVVDVGERELALTSTEIEELARLHGVGSRALEAVGGWPAATAVAAAYGIGGATEYVWDTVVEHLDPGERRVLAAAAAIGRGDGSLLAGALDDAPDDPSAILRRIPLVHHTDDGEFVVHDLWHRLVAGALDADERAAIITRTVEQLSDRGEHERAFDLCTTASRWDLVGQVVTASCRRGHSDVQAQVIAGWLEALPLDRWDEPAGLLLQGLVGRMHDPFGERTARLLECAAASHRAAGDVRGEVAATNELAYVLRNQGRCESLPTILARYAELETAGHPEVAGLNAIGRAFVAEFAGDDRQHIAELESIPAGSVSRDWQAVVDFTLAIAYLTLGDEHAMLAAAERCAANARATTARHVLALAHWFAGDPRPALATCDEVAADARRSRIDGVALGSFATMLLASAGRLHEAEQELVAAERAASGPLAVLMRGYVVGIRALVAAARGADDEARATLEAALAEAPIDERAGWRMATRWLALAYVLVPGTRAVIDGGELGAIHHRRVAVARATAAAREGRLLDQVAVADVRPELVATTVPLPWAMQLAGRLHAEGHLLGRAIVETSFGLYGQPVRESLRAAVGDPDRQVAAGARKLLAALTLAPRHEVHLDVLGTAVLRIDGHICTDADWQRERVRALLLYLVVHGPARREQIVEALWGDLNVEAADRNLRVTLTYLQRVLEPDRRKGEAPFLLRQNGTTLSLIGAPHLVVDLAEFVNLIDRADDADHRGVPSVARELFERALELWRGPCLPDVAYEEWAQATRVEITDRFVRAAVRAAELSLASGANDVACRLARRALTADEWCEPAHRVLIAAALANDDRAAAARALDACDRMLADLGVDPGAETLMLRRRLDAPRAVPELARSA